VDCVEKLDMTTGGCGRSVPEWRREAYCFKKYDQINLIFIVKELKRQS
jgi:hypothetical protein